MSAVIDLDRDRFETAIHRATRWLRLSAEKYPPGLWHEISLAEHGDLGQCRPEAILLAAICEHGEQLELEEAYPGLGFAPCRMQRWGRLAIEVIRQRVAEQSEATSEVTQ